MGQPFLDKGGQPLLEGRKHKNSSHYDDEVTAIWGIFYNSSVRFIILLHRQINFSFLSISKK